MPDATASAVSPPSRLAKRFPSTDWAGFDTGTDIARDVTGKTLLTLGYGVKRVGGIQVHRWIQRAMVTCRVVPLMYRPCAEAWRAV